MAFVKTVMLVACVGILGSPASASNCGGAPCSTRVAVKGNSVIPPDVSAEFAARGDLFSSNFTDLALQPNGSAQVDLGFGVNFGFGNVSSLFVNENGIVSFLRPIGTSVAGTALAVASGPAPIGFIPATSLDQFGVPVIAPFYANLLKGSGSGDGRLNFGDVVVQRGYADPFANGGAYSRDDARSAVRITWYGLDVAGDPASRQAAQVFAQLLISSDSAGLDNFEFRYGPLDHPGQQGFGSIAGFSLADNFLQFSGPYVDGIPNFFEFQDGKYIGQGATAAVPEPATWTEFLFGFGLIGYGVRSRRRREAAEAAL